MEIKKLASKVIKIRLYTLFYYDKPLLEAFLNHYCQFDAVDEIIIQDQNYSVENTMFLLKTVANYVDKYAKKVVVLPSNFKHIQGKNKRSQFLTYDQPAIRNRTIQFFKNEVFIMGALDEVIYGESYEYTDKRLKEFERIASERAVKKECTVGYLPLYSVFQSGVFPSDFDFKAISKPVYKERIFRFPFPFMHRGEIVHDTSIDIQVEGTWKRATISTCARSISEDKTGFGVEVPLKIFHYHTLVHSAYDSSEFHPVDAGTMKDLGIQPYYYLEKLEKAGKPVANVVNAVYEKWKAKIAENSVNGKPWFYGFPYRWWWGKNAEWFLYKLTSHLDPKEEPEWFK